MTVTDTPDTPSDVAKRRAWLWPGIVIGILGTHTIACLIVVYIATTDPSHAVVSDYHSKAMAWDDRQAQVRASSRLGWTCAIETALQADMLGQRSVRISLRDANSEPVADAQVSLRAFHHARAGDISEAEFREGAPGEYGVMMDMRRPGLWGFDIKAVRGDDTFIFELDQQVGPRTRSPR